MFSHHARRGELALPRGWEKGRATPDGKVYYIDHRNQVTTWIHPKDKVLKPSSFADCKDNELPYGWEQAYHPDFGVYFIDHNRCVNQIEDPRQQWRKEQERLLAEYVQEARTILLAKQDMLAVKQMRLALAQDDFQAYSAQLQECDRRRSIGHPVKHDPEKLHREVKTCKRKIAHLKVELERTKAEVEFQHEGLKTLECVDRKMSSHGSYHLEDAKAILTEVKDIQHALQTSEVEKAELMLALADLSQDLSLKTAERRKRQRRKLSNTDQKVGVHPHDALSGNRPSFTGISVERPLRSPRHASAYHRPSLKEKEYDEIQLRVCDLENRLADLDREVLNSERDRDRVLLLREKEALLVELKRVDPLGKTEEERRRLQLEKKRLEDDLRSSQQISQKIMEERLALQEEKSALLAQLNEANKSAAQVEVQLLSEQSRALARADFLNQAGSHHSLLSDISNDPFFQAVHGPKADADGDLPFQSLYRRVTHKRPSQVLTSSQTQTVPFNQPLYDRMSEVAGITRSVSQQEMRSDITHEVEEVSRRDCRDIMVQTDDETSIANGSMMHDPAQWSGLENQSFQTSATSLQWVASTQNQELDKTSIDLQTDEDGQFGQDQEMKLPMESSAVSSSGVLLQSMEPEEDSRAFVDSPEMGYDSMPQSEVFSNVDPAVVPIMNEVFKQDLDAEAPQLQVAMKYELDSHQLLVSVYEARNLKIEGMNSDWKVYVQASLIPSKVGPFRSEPLVYSISHMFHHVFEIPLEPESLQDQSLQITLWQVWETTSDDCLGGTQISLSEFKSNPYVPSNWYNLLSIEDVEDITEGRRKRTYSLSVRTPPAEQGRFKGRPTRRRTQSVLLKPSHKSLTPSGSLASMPIRRQVSNPPQMEKYLRYRNKHQSDVDQTGDDSTREEQRRRTSIDLELELETAKMKQAQVNADIANLKEMKLKMEESKAKGVTELPEWLTENGQLQSLLMDASTESQTTSKSSDRQLQRDKTSVLSRLSLEEMHVAENLPQHLEFRKQMEFFTSARVDIPPIPKDLS